MVTSNMVRELLEKFPKKVPHFKEVMKLLRFLEDLGRFIVFFFFEIIVFS